MSEPTEHADSDGPVKQDPAEPPPDPDKKRPAADQPRQPPGGRPPGGAPSGEEAESFDREAARTRAGILVYDVFILACLITLAILYFRTDIIGDALPSELRGLPAYTAWFGVLGSVAISFKGVSDHGPTKKEWSGKWPLWYLGRPFSGLLVGIVTYTLLRAVYPSGTPTIPTFEAAAFILGTQEAQFFAFLTAIAKVVLHIPGQDGGNGGGGDADAGGSGGGKTGASGARQQTDSTGG